MKIHRLKKWPVFFDCVNTRVKNFELRLNDRDYQIGDMLILEEYDELSSHYSGRMLFRKVDYIMKGPRMGIEADYVVLSLSCPISARVESEFCQLISDRDTMTTEQFAIASVAFMATRQ